MGIPIGLMGLGLTALGVVSAYIWKSNGKLHAQMVENQSRMMMALEHIEEGQRGIAQIVKEVAKMVSEHGKILERMGTKISSK